MAFATHLVLPFADRLRPTSRRGQSDRAQGRDETNGEPSHEQRLRGVIGYHNAFKDVAAAAAAAELADDDSPPSYTRSQTMPRRPLVRDEDDNNDNDHDSHSPDAHLPDYDCSVFTQGKVDMKLERKTPFDAVEDPKWETVYAVLQGTALNIHAVKSIHPLSMTSNLNSTDYRAGKLIRSYTLQHAEAGLAADHHKYELIPRSQLVYLLSASAQRQLQLTEPSKFDRVYQYVIRLRLENQQLLLRFKSSTDRTFWMHKISAAIDISPPLEARAEPKYVTLPRRRRRRVNAGDAAGLDALRDQQARIIREHYPQLAQDVPEDQGEPDTVHDVDDGRNADVGGADGAERDAEQDEEQAGPSSGDVGRRISSILDAHSSPHDLQARLRLSPNAGGRQSRRSNDDTDFDDDGKWAPHIPRDAAQESRIRRRCMPSLLFNSRRASNIIMMQGQRVKIDWESRSIHPWPELPPGYAHSLDDGDSMAESTGFPTLSQTQSAIGYAGTGRSVTRGLLLRARSTPERQRPDAAESAAASPTVDDVTSSDGSSHHTPGTKNFIARTANKLRRLTNRGADEPARGSKSSRPGTEQDALGKMHADVGHMDSTTSLAMSNSVEQRTGF